jgi:ABC-type nitrate/sulfonate/bicarbonate transport system permease component
MLASTDGIGFWISYHRGIFNTGQVYLGILLALFAAGIANGVVTLIERTYSHHTTEDSSR